MTFSTLALVIALGLIGPLFAVRTAWHVPVILGELAAGITFGATGFGVLDSSDPIFSFLADMGFAVVMFVAGTHVPVRDPRVRSAIGIGATRAVIVGLLSAAAGFGIAELFDTGNGAIYAVLLASSSAALVLPIIDAAGATGSAVLALTAQVAIADTACVVALPLVIDPGNAGRAAVGAGAVAACAFVMFLVLRRLESSGTRRRVHRLSEDRGFAIELRVSLVLLFALCAVATQTHVSIMLAGFAAGLAVAGIGEPRRVARQLFAINDGFLAPVFFVWLGARLNLREFAERPSLIGLGFVLGAGAVAVHLVNRFTGQPARFAALSAAQIGVPVAAVTVGGQLHVLAPGESSAIMLGALVTVGVAAIAASRIASRMGDTAET
ncbi:MULTISPECIES: cation:proton antiporter [Nocardia]|uniref:cation:proton antiporter n=1 Tax=Nocardia TaxID=1817 RepID=UPI000D68B14A|nr:MULTISPECIES: cation:proton antiporter [Nocardia]